MRSSDMLLKTTCDQESNCFLIVWSQPPGAFLECTVWNILGMWSSNFNRQFPKQLYHHTYHEVQRPRSSRLFQEMCGQCRLARSDVTWTARVSFTSPWYFEYQTIKGTFRWHAWNDKYQNINVNYLFLLMISTDVIIKWPLKMCLWKTIIRHILIMTCGRNLQ